MEYKDTLALAENISSIRKIMKMTDFTAIAFIARYGKPLFANKQEGKITRTDEKNGHDTDHYFDTRLSRRNTHLASQ